MPSYKSLVISSWAQEIGRREIFVFSRADGNLSPIAMASTRNQSHRGDATTDRLFRSLCYGISFINQWLQMETIKRITWFVSCSTNRIRNQHVGRVQTGRSSDLQVIWHFLFFALHQSNSMFNKCKQIFSIINLSIQLTLWTIPPACERWAIKWWRGDKRLSRFCSVRPTSSDTSEILAGKRVVTLQLSRRPWLLSV